MARFVGPFKFVGTVAGFESHWDADLQDYVLSSSKQKNPNHNKHAPRSQELNEEWKAVCMWSRKIRIQTYQIANLKKGRLAGSLNAIAKKIQEMDVINEHGKRQIESSKFNYPLISFCFNTSHPFSKVFHVAPELSINEDRNEVTLKMSEFISNYKFNWTETVRYYRVILTIFELPDLTWDTKRGEWDIFFRISRSLTSTTVSEWLPVITEPIDFEQKATFKDGLLPGEKSAVVVVMGLELASGMDWGSPYIVKDNGTAAVVGVF